MISLVKLSLLCLISILFVGGCGAKPGNSTTPEGGATASGKFESPRKKTAN